MHVQNVECGSTGVTCTKEVSVTITEGGNSVSYAMIKDRMISRNGVQIGIPHLDDSVG